MSRIGNVPIVPPDGVQVTVNPDMVVTIKGPKGQLTVDTKNNVTVRLDAGRFLVEPHGTDPQNRAYHGLYHRLITNAITGVSAGYTRTLQIVGVGYKAEMRGRDVVLTVGRSHTTVFSPPESAAIEVTKAGEIVVTGYDKQAVHEAAAQIRAVHPPEPYKGKGIRYKGENVRRKVGKTGVK